MNNRWTANSDAGAAEKKRSVGRSLLVILSLTILAVAGTPIWDRPIRDGLIRQLVRRVERAPDDQTAIPIRQLAEFGVPAIDSLVAIAASPRPVSAAAAREAINRQMATWTIPSRELAVHGPPALPSPWLARLARALAQHVDSMDVPGQHWAQRLTMQILLHADRLSPAQSVPVLADCQAVLAVVSPHGTNERVQDVTRQAIPREQKEQPLARPAMEWSLFATASQPEPRLIGLDTKGLFPLQPGRASEPHAASVAGQQQELQPTLRRLPSTNALDSAGSTPTPRGHRPTGFSVAGNEDQSRAETSTSPANPLREHSQAGVAAPPDLPKSDPTIPSPEQADHLPAPSQRELDAPTPVEMTVRRRQLQTMPLHDLLIRLAGAGDFEAALIRQEARARGLSDIELALAPRLASSQVKERLELLEQLSLLPARLARHWLRWLLEDADGKVRLRALTMMATTGEPRLEVLARRRMLEDTDPRVVALASRIVESRR